MQHLNTQKIIEITKVLDSECKVQLPNEMLYDRDKKTYNENIIITNQNENKNTIFLLNKQ